MRVAFGRVGCQHRGEIDSASLRVHGRDPVGGNEGDVPIAIAHAIRREQRIFKRLQVKRDHVEC